MPSSPFPTFGHNLIFYICSYTVEPKAVHSTTDIEIYHLFCSVSYIVHSVSQDRVQAALWATKTHYWARWSLSSTKFPRSLSEGFNSSLLFPHLYTHLELLSPRCRNGHLFSLNFIYLVIVQLSNLSRSLCKESLPSRESTASPNLVLSAYLQCTEAWEKWS